MPRLWFLPSFLVLFAIGCGGSEATTDASTSLDCASRCASKAQTCGAPSAQATQQCAALCPKVTTGAQLTCLESSSCADLTKLFQSTGAVCGIGETAGGAFGAACKCDPDDPNGMGAGQFSCTGTSICASGLYCIGSRTQGVDHGTCRGPVCCTGSQCNTTLGTQANCGAGQECKCERGDIECVGSSCTCSGGVPATKGLCWPKL